MLYYNASHLITPMGKKIVVLLCSLLVVAAAAMSVGLEVQDPVYTYIVHVAQAYAPRSSLNAARLTSAYTAFLHDVLPTHIREPAPSLLYSYAHAMTGFAARLTVRQAAHLEAQPSVLAVFPDELHELHTTLSPSFLELTPSSGLIAQSNGATDAVIAIIDTGIYPIGRASFTADPSLPPPPRTFRGGCTSTPAFNATIYCNNKLVGAKFFYKGHEALMGHPIDGTQESMSPLDTDGHGTHTASTAAGSAVPNANLFGFASGTAMGAAPRARIASYKVCWKGEGCPTSDILAGIEEAISDKVDVISLSLGGPASHLYSEITSTASFRAIRKGIVVSTSAGNDGPSSKPVNNLAPWVLTVGASTMNRRFPAQVVLGNGKTFIGTSLYSDQDSSGPMKPLVYAGDVGSAFCEIGKLDANKVAGKIVLCEPGNDPSAGIAVKRAGGAGAIISSTRLAGEYARSTAHLHPAVTVPLVDAQEIYNYSRSFKPVARIVFLGTLVGPTPSAPRVASFSSRGPNRFAPEILKPDVIAPGVDILAAWTGERSPTSLDIDTRRVKFNIISGTSMACPHVSGIAALLKVARPSWSPAAIKSALMTTAYNVDSSGNTIKDMATGKPAGPFELGAGHVDPNRALDPGLVYDAGVDDYISFMCALGYTADQIAIFTGDRSEADCWRRPSTSVGDLNYPAFSVVFKWYGYNVTQRRVVRNVGSNVNAVYTVSGTAPNGTWVNVDPGKLVFDAQHQTREYTITFSPLGVPAGTKYTYGSLVWSDGVHKVVSPMAVTWPAPTAVSAM